MTLNFNKCFEEFKKYDTNEYEENEALKYLIENEDIDLVSFLGKETIVPNSLSYFIKDNKNKYYIQIPVYKSQNDIISDLTVSSDDKNIEISLIINGSKFLVNQDIKIATFLAIYTDIQIRFTFSKDPTELIIKYKINLLKNSLRKEFIKNNKVLFDNFIYSTGMVFSAKLNDIRR